MNKIKKSISTILPTEQQKKRMYQNILSKKNKKTFKPILLLGPTFATMLFLFVIQENKENIVNLEPKTKEVGITIDNQNYCEISTYIGNLKSLNKLDNILPGAEVYQTKKGTLIIFNNNEYIEYGVCEGEIKNEKR